MLVREFVESEDALIAQALPMLKKHVLSGNDSGDLYQLRAECGLDPNDSSGEIPDESVENWCEERISDVLWRIVPLFDGDTIALYRMITASPEFKLGNQHPGIYWSWDEGAADAHWGDFSSGRVKWLITAQVKSSDIDWPISLVMNASPSYESEREIRLLSTSAPVVLSCARV